MSEHEHHSETRYEVRIHIDREPYESPNPTTGTALYSLGGVLPHHGLFKEVEGNREDKRVPNDGTEIHLKQDEHFYSEQIQFTIIVNANEKIVEKNTLSFDDLVALAFNPLPNGDNVEITITYRKGPLASPKGSLIAGKTVEIKNGMIFNVKATDKS
jgi:hypothetical protein